MATSYDLDFARFFAALATHQQLMLEYEDKVARGEEANPPPDVDQSAFMVAVVTISQTGKGAPLTTRPDTMGIDVLTKCDQLMDQFCAAASQFQRLRDSLLMAMWEAGQPASKPAAFPKADDFHNICAWIPRLDGVDSEGVKVLRYTHTDGLSFAISANDLKGKLLEMGDIRKVVISLADAELARANAPVKAYDTVRREQARYLRSRLVTEHGEEIADSLFRTPRADNVRAAALSDKAQSNAEKALLAAAKLDADMAAIDALCGLPDVLDAEYTPEVTPGTPEEAFKAEKPAKKR